MILVTQQHQKILLELRIWHPNLLLHGLENRVEESRPRMRHVSLATTFKLTTKVIQGLLLVEHRRIDKELQFL